MKTGRKLSPFLVGILFVVIVAVGLVWRATLIPRSNQISKCVLNLENIEECKHEWEGDQTNKNPNLIPTWGDLRPYFPANWSNQIPVCPDGGTYAIGRIGEPPTCSIGGPRHSLPQ
jgi:hypothetical protein